MYYLLKRKKGELLEDTDVFKQGYDQVLLLNILGTILSKLGETLPENVYINDEIADATKFKAEIVFHADKLEDNLANPEFQEKKLSEVVALSLEIKTDLKEMDPASKAMLYWSISETIKTEKEKMGTLTK